MVSSQITGRPRQKSGERAVEGIEERAEEAEAVPLPEGAEGAAGEGYPILTGVPSKGGSERCGEHQQHESEADVINGATVFRAAQDEDDQAEGERDDRVGEPCAEREPDTGEEIAGKAGIF